MRHVNPKRKAFTLIELLIVVAIIAILAAIAVPNFLEAQVRAKVSRGKNDMRAMATGLEAYKVDANRYPMDYQFYQGYNIMGYAGGSLSDRFAMCCLGRMTTPIAYMTSLPFNVFKYKPGNWYDGDPRWYGYKSEIAWRSVMVAGGITSEPDVELSKMWVLISVGPDENNNWGEHYLFGEKHLNSLPAFPPAGGAGCLYDPTNGTVSAGDICRVGP